MLGGMETKSMVMETQQINYTQKYSFVNIGRDCKSTLASQLFKYRVRQSQRPIWLCSWSLRTKGLRCWPYNHNFPLSRQARPLSPLISCQLFTLCYLIKFFFFLKHQTNKKIHFQNMDFLGNIKSGRGNDKYNKNGNVSQ